MPCRRADFPRISSQESGFFFCGAAQAARALLVRSNHKLEFGAAPKDQVLGDPGKVHPEERAGRGELDVDVPVGDRVHRVLGDPRAALRVDKSKLPRREFPVDGERRAGDGTRAERAYVCLVGYLQKTGMVALQHLHPGEQVVGDEDRLRPLKVRVAGDDHVPVRLRGAKEGPLGPGNLLREDRARVLEEQPHVGRNLVVAASARVELRGSGDAKRQRMLDVHVDVLQPDIPDEAAALNLR